MGEDAAAVAGHTFRVVLDDEAAAVADVAILVQIEAHRLGGPCNRLVTDVPRIDDAVVERRGRHVDAVVRRLHRQIGQGADAGGGIAERRTDGEDAGRCTAVAFALLRALCLRRMHAEPPGAAAASEHHRYLGADLAPWPAVVAFESLQARAGCVPVRTGDDDQLACIGQWPGSG
ncbi:hypothetical protein CMZ80_08460 [Lysobacteraceae bacterium NML93-0831]|nr:hypothetical protein CMZ81_06315 [Xanthomonadaceae bacterium NML93-0793]PBS19206.1 hypothetical protein CMZ80_08460 [Xanthomonadaceae bacterium NML93-0831]